MKDYFNSPIFILGLPRSGTSMVAGALKISGAWTGRTVPGDDASNPKGFFEHIIIREHIIKRLLISIGCDPLGVRKFPDVNLQGEISGLADVVKSVLENDGYKNDRPWMYKDAKLTLLWPYFIKAFPDARWIIVKRDLDGFINSCRRTHFMKQHSIDPDFWKLFAEEYQIRLDTLKGTSANVFEISSPEIISGEFTRLKEIVLQLGLTYREKELKGFISPNYWHSGSNEIIN